MKFFRPMPERLWKIAAAGTVVLGLLFIGAIPIAAVWDYQVIEYHHCVVRQATVEPDGWSLVVQGEVGAVWVLHSDTYRRPGTSLYVGRTRGGPWKIVPPPK